MITPGEVGIDPTVDHPTADPGGSTVGATLALAALPGPPRWFRRMSWPVWVSVIFIAIITAAAILAPWLRLPDPAEQNLSAYLSKPGRANLLGTDDLGRDVLSRLVYAARLSLIAPLIAVGTATLIGLPMGIIAGYFPRGPGNWLVERIFDTALALPGMVFAIAIIGALGPGITNAMFAFGIVISPGMYRVVRAATVTTREATFIESARSIGCSRRHIIGVHLLPNIAPTVLVQMTLYAGIAIIAEASLSFLGLGVQAPDASWGVMLRQAFDRLAQSEYLIFPPGIMIFLTVLAINTIGEHLGEVIGRRAEVS